MVELDHRFETGKAADYNWDAILDLDRIIPCVEGGKVLERESARRWPRPRSRSRWARCR